jgi:hypothetical protein
MEDLEEWKLAVYPYVLVDASSYRGNKSGDGFALCSLYASPIYLAKLSSVSDVNAIIGLAGKPK